MAETLAANGSLNHLADLDSITQFALGAALGEAVLGKKAGARAPIVGGLVASLPDIDVIYPFANDVASFTWHRGVTHSLLVLALVAPIISAALMRTRLRHHGHPRDWRLLVYLALLTHPLLDALTIYGTQLLWPLPLPPVTWSTLFIIDPLVTVPLIAGLIGVRLARRFSPARHANWLGMALAIAYVTWSIGAKMHVDRVFLEGLQAQGIEVRRMISTPLPLTTLSWRAIAMHQGGYTQGVYRMGEAVRFETFESHPKLLEGLPAAPDIERLEWFTKGFYKVLEKDGRIIFTDLRMGHEPNYAFRFDVGPDLEAARQLASPINFERYSEMLDAL